MTTERLSNRQIATLKHLAICCANGGQVTLTREQREAMQPLWRRGIVEMWFRCIPDEGNTRSPFFRPTGPGWHLIRAILALLLAGALWSHLVRSPAERIVRKRFG